MSLFTVPGWSVPSAPVPESKKRKRPARTAEADDKVRGVEVNLEKLVAKMDSLSGKSETRTKKKARRESVAVEGASLARPKGGDKEATPKKVGPGKRGKEGGPSSGQGVQKPGKVGAKKSSTHSSSQSESSVAAVSKNMKKAPQSFSASTTTPATVSDANISKPKKKLDAATKHLTALQSGMKNSLEGARFRWINEELYKSDSMHAHEMMRDDPNVFHEYHRGFRNQVESWPSNPVSHYIRKLSEYPAKTVIADLGCGDAALARALIPKDFTVLSYDLVSDGAFVTEADIFARLPLPGTFPEDDDTKHEGEAQVVDVIVCALSLMGTNWPRCIREAWRVLRAGGELKIAEVASRFTDVEGFESLIVSCGFKLVTTDSSNTHFTLFEFKKVAMKSRSEDEWNRTISNGSLLKPCEYKRR